MENFDYSSLVDLSKIVEKSVKLNSDNSTKKNIEIIKNFEGDLSKEHVDKNAVKQVLTKLLAKLIEVSFKNSKISIFARNIGNNLEVKFSNQACEALEVLENIEKMVAEQRGSIFIDRNSGDGALVSLYLPNRNKKLSKLPN